MQKDDQELDITPKKSVIDSISNLIKAELYTILRDLKLSENVIKNCDIDALIEKCLIRNALVIGNSTNAKDQKHQIVDDEQQNLVEQERIAAINNKITRTALIIENFEILDERLTSLEKQILTLMPKPSDNTCQISTTITATEESTSKLDNNDKLLDLADVVTGVFTENSKIEEKKLIIPEQIHHTHFEDTKSLAIHQDQIDFNLLKCQNSDTTLRFNLRPAFNNVAPPAPDSIARYIKKFGDFGEFGEDEH